MGRRFFWVMVALILSCFSRFCFAQSSSSTPSVGMKGQAVLSNGTIYPIQFSNDPPLPVPFNVPLWRVPFTQSTYFSLSSGGSIYSSDAAFGSDLSAPTPLGITILETDFISPNSNSNFSLQPASVPNDTGAGPSTITVTPKVSTSFFSTASVIIQENVPTASGSERVFQVDGIIWVPGSALVFPGSVVQGRLSFYQDVSYNFSADGTLFSFLNQNLGTWSVLNWVNGNPSSDDLLSANELSVQNLSLTPQPWNPQNGSLSIQDSLGSPSGSSASGSTEWFGYLADPTQNNETLLSIQGQGPAISTSMTGEAAGAAEPTDSNIQTWISEAEADNPDTTIAFTTSPVLACAATASASSGTDAPLLCSGTDNLVIFAVDPSVMAAADLVKSIQVGQEQIKVDLSPKIIHPRNLIYLHENGISGNLTVTSVPTQYGVVFVSVNNLPVGQPLTVFLKAEAVRDSGGHFYDTDRPNGSFVSPQSSHTFLGSTIPFTIVGENNPSACQGKVAVGNCFTIAYRPPQVGGKVKISVTASGATVENKPEFHVQVPGSLGNTSSFLLQFANLPFDNLEKDSFLLQTYSQYFVIRGDGPTSSYTNPLFQCTVTNGHRYVGHYAIFEMLSDLARAAQKFYERTGGIPLQIGDLSLPDGGVFDLCSNWIPPHSFHRIGNSVSIDIQGLTEEEIKILRSKMWRYHFLENTGFHNEGVLEYEWFPSQSPEIALLP